MTISLDVRSQRALRHERSRLLYADLKNGICDQNGTVAHFAQAVDAAREYFHPRIQQVASAPHAQLRDGCGQDVVQRIRCTNAVVRSLGNLSAGRFALAPAHSRRAIGQQAACFLMSSIALETLVSS